MGGVVRWVGTGSGQARVKNQEDEKQRGWEKTGADRTNAGKLDKQDELMQTDRKHRYKSTGDKGEDWRHLEGGGGKHNDK